MGFFGVFCKVNELSRDFIFFYPMPWNPVRCFVLCLLVFLFFFSPPVYLAESVNRIIEYIKLTGTHKDHGILKLKNMTKSIIQMPRTMTRKLSSLAQATQEHS